MTAAKIRELEAELKERGYKVDSTQVEVYTPWKRSFVDIDAPTTAVSFGLTVSDIVKYGPYRRRKDGSAGRALNSSMQDMERVVRVKLYNMFFERLRNEYPASKYRFEVVEENMEQTFRDKFERPGLAGEEIIMACGPFGSTVCILPSKKREGEVSE